MPITNPDWVPPIEINFDVGKPIRSEQGLLLAGNPIAIAEGAEGAPRVQGKALDGIRGAPVASGGSNVTYNNLDDFSFAMVLYYFTANQTNYGLQIDLSTDNGSSFLMSAGSSADGRSGVIYLGLRDGNIHGFGGSNPAGEIAASNIYNAIRLRTSFNGPNEFTSIIHTLEGEP